VGIGGAALLLGGLAKAGYITVDIPKIEKQVLAANLRTTCYYDTPYYSETLASSTAAGQLPAAAISCRPHTYPDCRTPMPYNQVLTIFDVNKDGKLDAADYKFASQRALTLIEANGRVAGGAFVAGFAYGFGARAVA
jgi:hypothetical protein|tara:strand:- start:97 stop:507 length:411 start_codon:yes stop_codon:yes gene_type:complete